MLNYNMTDIFAMLGIDTTGGEFCYPEKKVIEQMCIRDSICRVHTQVGHDFTFRGEFLQRLFPVFAVLGQKVLIDGAGGGVDLSLIHI